MNKNKLINAIIILFMVTVLVLGVFVIADYGDQEGLVEGVKELQEVYDKPVVCTCNLLDARYTQILFINSTYIVYSNIS
jgi:hypothetical protein